MNGPIAIYAKHETRGGGSGETTAMISDGKLRTTRTGEKHIFTIASAGQGIEIELNESSARSLLRALELALQG